MSPELQTALGEVAVAQPEISVAPQIIEAPQIPVVIPDLVEFTNETWTRTPIPLTFNGTEYQITGAQSNSLIRVHNFKSAYDNLVTDTSIRMRVGDTSYILRYDADEEYEAWELIKSVPANGSSPQGAEQAIFKHRTADPDMVIEDAAVPEWQRVRENLTGLLTSLPDEFPEKNKLQGIWAPLTLTGVTEKRLIEERKHLEQQQAYQAEKQRKVEEFNQQFMETEKRTLLQKVGDALTSPFKRWRERGQYRPQPRYHQGGSYYHDVQYYRRSNGQ